MLDLARTLTNPDLLLLHDMYVDAQIETGSGDLVLTVPDSAVMDTGSRQAVFVDKGQGRFDPREVKLGHRGPGYVEIRQGIADGEPVVVSKPDGPEARIYRDIASKVWERIKEERGASEAAVPSIVFE